RLMPPAGPRILRRPPTCRRKLTPAEDHTPCPVGLQTPLAMRGDVRRKMVGSSPNSSRKDRARTLPDMQASNYGGGHAEKPACRLLNSRQCYILETRRGGDP